LRVKYFYFIIRISLNIASIHRHGIFLLRNIAQCHPRWSGTQDIYVKNTIVTFQGIYNATSYIFQNQCEPLQRLRTALDPVTSVNFLSLYISVFLLLAASRCGSILRGIFALVINRSDRHPTCLNRNVSDETTS
jgi:hypothetical protein